MNLKLRLLLLLVIVSLGAQAQTVYMKPHLGLRLGLNVARSTYSPNFIYNLKAQSHPNLGVFYRMRTKKWAFQPEVQLSVRGGTFKSETAVIRNNFNYASFVPVVGYIITEGLTFEVAPEFSYALSTLKSVVPLRKNEFSLGSGLRFDFMDMGEDFSLNVRYIHGFTNLSTSKTETLSNKTLQVSVIYNLYKKK
ncbi:outer membrane beta-barrel protein [Runella sp.]|uniref:outer membrane beta-barrel protein n=1 Tax=Runella sp. TaxID=1960881 RepID=UPI003D0D6CED